MKEIKYELDKTDSNYSDWAIYYIRNLTNEKLYIGSSVSYKSRLYSHYSRLCRGVHVNHHLQNAWNKYGEENFEFGIIEYIDKTIYSELELREIEEIYMEYFNVCNKNFGYNAHDNAIGEGHKHTEETKKHMSDIQTGHYVSFETRMKISETRKKMYQQKKNNTPKKDNKIKKISKVNSSLTQKQLDALEKGRGTKYYTEETYKKLSEANRGENSGTSKLKEKDVIEILELIKNKVNYREIGDKFNISLGHISDIKYARAWRYLYEQNPELYPWNP